jgi:hypothetical protein
MNLIEVSYSKEETKDWIAHFEDFRFDHINTISVSRWISHSTPSGISLPPGKIQLGVHNPGFDRFPVPNGHEGRKT